MNEIRVEDKGLMHLLAALEVLKDTGGKHQDSRHVWCTDWMRCVSVPAQIFHLYLCWLTSWPLLFRYAFQPRSGTKDADASMEYKARSAKTILQRLNSARKALAAVSKSLEDVFQFVTDESADAIRITGFSSLPDDILARIFELNHRAGMETVGFTSGMASVSASNVLAQVCRRFRRIALHIPSLWEDVFNCQRKDWIINLKGRSRNPIIFITYNTSGAKSSIDNLLGLVHPAKQWKGLDVRFCKRRNGHDFFKRIASGAMRELNLIETLAIQHDWEHLGSHIDDDGAYDDDDYDDDNYSEDSDAEDEDDEPEEDEPSTNISQSDSTRLSKLSLPKLNKLKLVNLIPSRINCPNLRMCHLELSRMINVFTWDLQALKGLLSSIHLVESLSFRFCNAGTSEDHDVSRSEPVKFPNLKSLTMTIEGYTQTKFLNGIMGIMDVAVVSDLKISMGIYTLSVQAEAEDVKTRLPVDWLGAIFRSWGYRGTGESGLRIFPNVEVLRLEIFEEAELVPFSDIFQAVPRVRDLTLELPRCYEPQFSFTSGRRFEGLNGLRSLHLKNCTSFSGHDWRTFLKERNETGDIEKIERVKVEGCNDFLRYWGANEFRKLLGDKLDWKA